MKRTNVVVIGIVVAVSFPLFAAVMAPRTDLSDDLGTGSRRWGSAYIGHLSATNTDTSAEVDSKVTGAEDYTDAEITALNLGTMSSETATDYYDKIGTDAEITALNLGTMSSETATDYDTSTEVDVKVAASTNSFPAAGITTIADAATLELSGATGNYFSAPTTWRTNTLSIAGTAADYGYSLFLASTNPVALAADMIAFGDLPDNTSGRVFGFTPHTNSTWLVIGVTP